MVGCLFGERGVDEVFVDDDAPVPSEAEHMMSLPAVQVRFVECRHHLHAHLADVLDRTRQSVEACRVDATVHARIKSPSSVWRKMHRCALTFEQVYDLLGLRVLVGSVDDCYRVLDALLGAWPERLVVVKDYVRSPKDNGYQSIHLRVADRDEPPFEVQIRTWEMHEQSEQGPAAHWRYKHGQSHVALGA